MTPRIKAEVDHRLFWLNGDDLPGGEVFRKVSMTCARAREVMAYDLTFTANVYANAKLVLIGKKVSDGSFEEFCLDAIEMALDEDQVVPDLCELYDRYSIREHTRIVKG